LQATALVHEAYIRLVDSAQAQRWDSRAHFFGAAADETGKSAAGSWVVCIESSGIRFTVTSEAA
jgi:hypothetical protein